MGCWQVRAVEAYAKAKRSDDAISLALEIELRAKRRAGEFLRDMPKGGPATNRNSLLQLGISRIESSPFGPTENK